MSYGNKFVAFIDILGFTNMIMKSQDNPSDYHKVKAIVECVLEYTQGQRILSDMINTHNQKCENDRYPGANEIAVFSDSIVISYAIGDGLDSIIMNMSCLILDLLEMDVFVRGGISCGKAEHEGNVCFGPAVITAYQLENTAQYPRVVVDEDAIRKHIEYIDDELKTKIESSGRVEQIELIRQIKKRHIDRGWQLFRRLSC